MPAKLELMNARGTRDTLPAEQIVKEKIAAVLKETFELYGFSPLETPILERYDILSAKYAGGEEILKETFRLHDQGKRELGLRYDLTVPLARVIGMNPQLKMPFKRYAMGYVFRDGPVSLARYRQFTQCDIDIVGSMAMAADAECITIAHDAFRNLGFDALIRISSRKLLSDIMEKAGIPQSRREGAILSIDKLERFGKGTVEKELEEKGISKEAAAGIFSIIGQSGSNAEKLAAIVKEIGESEGSRELKDLMELLDALKISYDFDPSLARGLSYYTGTIFEAFLKESKVKSAVCSGGRWDNLIGEFLGRGDFPAVGLSFGLDRIFDACMEKKKDTPKTVTQLYLIPIGNQKDAYPIARQLREKGIKTEMDLNQRGVTKNLKYASSLGIPFVAFAGEDELRQKKLKLRNMMSGAEELLLVQDIIRKLKS